MFTSRLPKSTSVRRPSAPGEGSTSFGYSSIPVSVKKANLFTPKPERSHSSLASSTIRKPYMTTDKKRSSKPDSDEQMRMFRSLTDLIKSTAPNFPMPEARKFLSQVSTTEVSRIFEVLFSQINPGFKMTKNHDQDARKQLEKLGYPNQIGKYTLTSVANRQAVGALLVIYDWLVNYIKCLENEDSQNDSEEDIVFESMMLDPEGQDGEQWLHDNLMESYLKNDTESDIFVEGQAIEEEIKQLAFHQEEINEFLEAINVSNENFDRWKKFCVDLEAYIETIQNQLQDYESKRLDAEIETAKDRHQDLNMKTIGMDEQELNGKFISLSNEMNLVDRQDIDGALFSQLEQGLHDLDRKLAELREKRKRDLESRRIDIENRIGSCESEEAEAAKTEKLHLEYLKSVFSSLKERAEAIIRREESENEYWTDVGRILRQNNETAKAAQKMIRKNL